MRCIDPASRWAFVGVLCLAQELGQNGLLLLNGKPLSDAAIADAIGVDLAMWHEVLAYFLDTGGFHIDPSGALCVTNFAKRQADTLGKRPHKSRWEVIRNAVFQRDDFTCRYCGERAERPECDHIVPVSRGGSNTLDNLATSCQRCNRSKRDKTPSEWRSEYELV